MAAEDYLPNGWEIELYEAYSTDFLTNPETKMRMNEERMIEETLCPDCGGKMVSRKSQYGSFWGCASYPKCKGTRNSMGRSKADRAKEKGEDYESDSKDEANKFSFKRTR